MRALILALALAGCSTLPGVGAPFAVATSGDGATVTLHDGLGGCVGDARYAVWASPDRTRTVPGCWIATGTDVLVSFLDGERGNIPWAHLRKTVAL